MRRGPVVVNTRRGPGLMGTMAKTAVIAGTATVTAKAVSGAMNSGSQQKAAAQQQATDQQQQMADLQAQQTELAAQQQAMAAQQAAAPQAAATESNSLDDQLVQIQKLSVMKDQGVITEEEFQAKKKQILGL